MSRPIFRQRPGATPDEIQKEVQLAFDRLGDIIPRRIPNLRIGVNETKVAHGQRDVPSQWRAVNHAAGVVIEQTRPADERFLYLRRQGSIVDSLVGSPSGNSMRSQGQWHVWGMDRGNAPSFGAIGANVGPNGAFDNEYGMSAIPGYFPEAGQITALAVAIADAPTVTGVNPRNEYGWLGVAPDTIVAGEHWPDSTIAGSGVQVIGGNSGSSKLRGGTVAIDVPAGSLLWAIYQNRVVFAVGLQYFGGSMDAFPNWGGYDDLSGVAIGSTPPSTISGSSAIGYCSLVGVTLPYAVDSDFPATGRRLRTANDIDSSANQLWNAAGSGIPYFLYQWTRTSAPATTTGDATILNETDAVTDIEVL